MSNNSEQPPLQRQNAFLNLPNIPNLPELEFPDLPPPIALQRQVASPNSPPLNNPPNNPPPQAPRFDRQRRYAFFLDNIDEEQRFRNLRDQINIENEQIQDNDNNDIDVTESLSSDYSTDTDYDDNEDLTFLNKFLDKMDKNSEEYKTLFGQIRNHKKRMSSLCRKNKQLISENRNNGKIMTKLILKGNRLERYDKNYLKTMESLPTKIIINLLRDNKCPICLSEADRIGETVITSCFHVFHKECLNRAMENNKKCPMCRHDLTFTYSKNVKIGIEKRTITNIQN